jgi:hypothetical protein
LTFRERVLAIFRREPVDNIVYQPRIEHWYKVNKHLGTLPERYKDMSLLEVYDDLGCSIRSYGWYNGCLKFKDDPSVKVETIKEGEMQIVRWSTPVGSIETHNTYPEQGRCQGDGVYPQRADSLV